MLWEKTWEVGPLKAIIGTGGQKDLRLVGWFVRYVMCVYFLLGYKTNWMVG